MLFFVRTTNEWTMDQELTLRALGGQAGSRRTSGGQTKMTSWLRAWTYMSLSKIRLRQSMRILLEEQSCQISSRSDLERRILTFFLKAVATSKMMKNNNNKMGSDMGPVPGPKSYRTHVTLLTFHKRQFDFKRPDYTNLFIIDVEKILERKTVRLFRVTGDVQTYTVCLDIVLLHAVIQESRAIAGRTARCSCKFWCVGLSPILHLFRDIAGFCAHDPDPIPQ